MPCRTTLQEAQDSDLPAQDVVNRYVAPAPEPGISDRGFASVNRADSAAVADWVRMCPFQGVPR
jgi:hypothetical protein